MTLEGILYFYQYNTWATERLLEALEQLTPEQYIAPGCSGNGSIRDTLAHLFAVQYSWFSWYDDTMKVEEAIRYAIPGEEISTIALARERWMWVKEKTNSFLSSLTEEKITGIRTWSFPNMDGGAVLWKLLLHTANHGTHMRAQIVAAIRRFGYNPGALDLLQLVLKEAMPQN